ncbi:uncharacterized protein MONBRDRAFT_8655 [Monosiga brevicollis MX1]|uniref:Uncharacterized protein n=1 Tax=Monosiga brevicollis TaxID=81824 RepID=A9V0Q6_MONBE|nr:uncharacterized protein MONBRDRAFT_8655 [Monosiga brevicollis MX1]EDQ88794.1 predicted protein [Monosiga brevicollis MX1]|eukprot:XP_001746407.1 hypothetical protein [Monosiga brevicollis MX1]
MDDAFHLKQAVLALASELDLPALEDLDGLGEEELPCRDVAANIHFASAPSRSAEIRKLFSNGTRRVLNITNLLRHLFRKREGVFRRAGSAIRVSALRQLHDAQLFYLAGIDIAHCLELEESSITTNTPTLETTDITIHDWIALLKARLRDHLANALHTTSLDLLQELAARSREERYRRALPIVLALMPHSCSLPTRDPSSPEPRRDSTLMCKNTALAHARRVLHCLWPCPSLPSHWPIRCVSVLACTVPACLPPGRMLTFCNLGILAEHNKMTYENLARCIAPSLLPPVPDSTLHAQIQRRIESLVACEETPSEDSLEFTPAPYRGAHYRETCAKLSREEQSVTELWREYLDALSNSEDTQAARAKLQNARTMATRFLQMLEYVDGEFAEYKQRMYELLDVMRDADPGGNRRGFMARIMTPRRRHTHSAVQSATATPGLPVASGASVGPHADLVERLTARTPALYRQRPRRSTEPALMLSSGRRPLQHPRHTRAAPPVLNLSIEDGDMSMVGPGLDVPSSVLDSPSCVNGTHPRPLRRQSGLNRQSRGRRSARQLATRPDASNVAPPTKLEKRSSDPVLAHARPPPTYTTAVERSTESSLSASSHQSVKSVSSKGSARVVPLSQNGRKATLV